MAKYRSISIHIIPLGRIIFIRYRLKFGMVHFHPKNTSKCIYTSRRRFPSIFNTILLLYVCVDELRVDHHCSPPNHTSTINEPWSIVLFLCTSFHRFSFLLSKCNECKRERKRKKGKRKRVRLLHLTRSYSSFTHTHSHSWRKIPFISANLMCIFPLSHLKMNFEYLVLFCCFVLSYCC